jgi:DNA-binding winged helix-turn-helix (wHTH) protein
MLSQGGPRYVLGDWALCAATARLERGSEVHTLEPRHAQVLAVLCERAGEVLSAEDLLAACWGGEPSGDNPVHKAVAMLRRALGDSATAPRYIETLRKRGYRLLVPVRRVGAAQALAHQGGWTLGSPFRGLQAFGPEHAAVFYGREQATQSLLRAALAQLQPAASGLCVVLGPSGSGKSSLVQAGLIPALLSRPAAPLTAGGPSLKMGSVASLHLGEWAGEPNAAEGQAPAGELLQALALALLDWELNGRAVFEGHSANSLSANLLHSLPATLNEFSVRLERHEALEAPPAREVLVLFIDQLEALFTRASGAEASGFAPGSAAQHFAEVLQALLATGQVLVVAACRNDFYPQLMAHSAFMQAKATGGHFDLMPPSRAEVAQMVRLPARAAGLSFGLCPQTSVSLDELLVEDAAYSPDALPLLQFTLQQLWQQRSPEGELSVATYRALGGGQGGLEGVIAEQAERVLRQLTPVQQAGLPHVLSLLVVVGEDEAEAAPVGGRLVLWRELRGAAQQELVQALVDARLLVTELHAEGQAQEPGFRVAHEALLRRWPRVVDWTTQHRRDLHTRARLRQQAQRWGQGQHATEFLLPPGRQLQEARALVQSSLLPLEPELTAFIRASHRRAGRALRWRGVLAGVLGMLAVAAGFMAWRNYGLLQQLRQKNESSQRLVSTVLGGVLEQLRPAAQLSVIEAVGRQALQLLGEEADDSESAQAALPSMLQAAKGAGPQSAPALQALQARLQRAKALVTLGEATWGKRQAELARPALLRAHALLAAAPFAQLPPSLRGEWATVQGAAAYWVWEMASAGEAVHGSAAEWALAYEDAIAPWLEAEPRHPGALKEMGDAQNNLGITAVELGQWALAQQRYLQAVKHKVAAMALQPVSEQAVLDLAATHQALAQVAQWQGLHRQALAANAEALALLGTLSTLPNHQHRKAVASRQRAKLLGEAGQWPEAADALLRALKLARAAAQADPDSFAIQANRWWAELDAQSFEGPQLQGLTSGSDVASQLAGWIKKVSLDEDHLQRLMAEQARTEALQLAGNPSAAVALARQASAIWAARARARPEDGHVLQQWAKADVLLLSLLAGPAMPGVAPAEQGRLAQVHARDMTKRWPQAHNKGLAGSVAEAAFLAKWWAQPETAAIGELQAPTQGLDAAALALLTRDGYALSPAGLRLVQAWSARSISPHP